jgi:hypothetical protein
MTAREQTGIIRGRHSILLFGVGEKHRPQAECRSVFLW